MCENSNQIHAYHDDELNAIERAAFEAHLESCEPCRSALAELKAISRSLTTAALPSMPLDLPSRILDAYGAARRAQDRATRKLAGWLTAAAAIVLVVAMLRVSGLTDRNSDNTALVDVSTPGSRDWELAALMPPDRQADDTGTGSADLIQLAQWMARDLSPDERR